VSKNWNRILLYGLLAKIAKDTLLVEWITSTSDVTLFEAVKSVVMKSLDDAETTKQANENDLFWRLFAQIVMRTDPDFLTLMYACFVSGKLDNLEDPQVLCRVVRLQQRNGFVF
jgi:hypothetical protein